MYKKINISQLFCTLCGIAEKSVENKKNLKFLVALGISNTLQI